jgi:hypothetical protein
MNPHCGALHFREDPHNLIPRLVTTHLQCGPHAIMTQPVIQKFNENTCRSMPAKMYIPIASCWPKLSSWIDGIVLITTDLYWLWARDPGIIAIKKYKWERKTWKKHSFSDDGKHFTDFVLLRYFTDFHTTLVDSRHLLFKARLAVNLG